MKSYFNKGVCVRERERDRKSKSKTARDVAEVAEGEDRKYVGSSFVAWILG